MEFYYYSPSETFVVLTAEQFLEIRCIGKVLLVLSSRLKNEVYIHVSQCLSSVFIFADCF